MALIALKLARNAPAPTASISMAMVQTSAVWTAGSSRLAGRETHPARHRS